MAEEGFNFGAKKPQGGSADVSALAEKIAELSAENEKLKAELNNVRQENVELTAARKRALELAQDKTDWKQRAEIAEGEAATLKAALDRAEKSLAEIGRKSEKVFQPFEAVMKNFQTATQLVNGIKDSADALNRAAKTAKETTDQYDGSRSWKDVLVGIGEYVLIGVFLFGCSYMGSVYGETPEKIENIRDLVYRIAYNQYFTPWGIEPINPFINGVDATKIWNATYNNWIEQQQQPQEPQE